MKRRKSAPPDCPRQTEGERKAEEALGDSIMQRIAADMKANPVKEIACSLQQIRERNHFAEGIEELFGGAK